MRTTIDIPDPLFRQVKARAAARGLKLKEYVAAALEQSLFEHRFGSDVREVAAASAEDALDLGEGCVLPKVSGEAGEEMASISGERIAELLEEEDSDDALLPRGP